MGDEAQSFGTSYDAMGGSPYDNFSYYGNAPQNFPNSGWGYPPSPSYVMNSPNTDFMSRSNSNPGTGAFASPMGINFGGPMMNLMATLALQMATNGKINNIRPLTQPDLPDLDYLRARERMATSWSRNPEIFKVDTPYMSDRVGPGFASNPMFQPFLDQINPAGSAKNTFDMIYGRMGTAFGGDLQHQADMSQTALEEMTSGFQIKSGPNKGDFDFGRTFGMDREQLIDSYDAGSRRGIAGASRQKFEEAVASKDPTALTKLLGGNAEVFSAAKNVFGKDKNMDELAKLMTESVDGIQGMDTNKATDMLNKIQVAARVVDINTKAFAAYSNLFSDMNKSLTGGIGHIGSVGMSTGIVSSALIGAKAMAESAKATGDVDLMDVNVNAKANAEIMTNTKNSYEHQQMTALGSMLSNMTDSQASSIRLKDGRTMLDLKNGGLRELADSGDSSRIQAVLGQMPGLQSQGFDYQTFVTTANNVNANDERRAQTVMGDGAAGLIRENGNSARKFLAATMASDPRLANMQARMGGKEGWDKFLVGLTPAQMGNQAAVKARLESMGIRGAGVNEFAGTVANSLNAKLGRLENDGDGGWGMMFGGNVESSLYQASTAGIQAHDNLMKQAEKEKDLETVLLQATGSQFKGISSEAKIAGLDVLKKLQDGTLKDKDGHLINKKDLTNKDGTWNVSRVQDLVGSSAAEFLTKFSGVDAMESISKVLSTKNSDDILNKADKAYDEALKKENPTNDPKKKQAAMDKAYRVKQDFLIDQGQKLNDQINDIKGDTETKPADNPDSPDNKQVSFLEQIYLLLKGVIGDSDKDPAPQPATKGS